MKPIQPNYKSDLKQIRTAIADLAVIVTTIKNQLVEVSEKVDNPNQLNLDLPTVTTSMDYHEEEQ